MSEIPEDLMRAAKRAYMTYPKSGEDEWMPIARAFLAERQRVLNICAAEREWGDFHYDDVTGRIELGEQPRQIEGWNCPSSDDASP